MLGLGELLEFPTESERNELAAILTEMINEGSCRLCDKPKLYDAAVVNKDGLLVRTEIFEGNRQDVSTLKDVLGSLENGLPEESKHLIVMDAGFSSRDNLQWLRDNGYDSITVMRSTGTKYTAEGPIKMVTGNKEQTIRLQMASVNGIEDTVLLVDSDAKTAKERSMYELFVGRYEAGMANIKAGIAEIMDAVQYIVAS